MDTSRLKKFAQHARHSLREQIEKKLTLVLANDSAARRQSPVAVKELEDAIKKNSKEQVVEKVAYTWFNRFCALRFMDANRYTKIGIVSPTEAQSQPEILAEAKMGHVPEQLVPEKARLAVISLLRGETTSPDPQSDAYRLLLVAACNFYHSAMPFLFERIDDFTELLLPDDLLSESSILTQTRDAMTLEACENVEVIGWLYQFYISEKKDEVFAGLKKNKKITPNNIPAATQLFTPHWIVRYLVENSLGRLWMLNRPNSKLVEQMEYYIAPEEVETDFLRVESPEELRICDPACGSGHMLVFAFDLLYAIYEEEGYEPSEIPEKILTQNLFGIEIDERAGALAAFALSMKAREKYRRFFRKKVQPNICVLASMAFTDSELNDYMDFVGRDLFTAPLLETLKQFSEADNFGSLIQPVVTDVQEMLRLLEGKDVGGQLLLYQVHQKVLQVLKQADYLSPKYHVVVANPPYMGDGKMNGGLKAWVKKNYPKSKSALSAAFVERNLDLAKKRGSVAMITMQSWMFLSSLEKLRSAILENDTILSMAHLGARAFDSIGGEVVSTTAFVLENSNDTNHKGNYLRLIDGNSEAEKETAIREAINNPDCGYFFRVSASNFRKIPGSPIAYWVSDKICNIFKSSDSLQAYADIRTGMQTGNNERFLRLWPEVSISYINSPNSKLGEKRWHLYSKGGDFRRWYGNVEHLVDWKNNGAGIKGLKVNGSLRSRVRELSNYCRKAASWSFISSAYFGCRYKEPGVFFDVAGSCALENNISIEKVLGLLCSKLSTVFLNCLNPTLNFQIQDISNIPYRPGFSNGTEVKEMINLAEKDWNSYESSVGFNNLPLLTLDHRQISLCEAYQYLRSHWQKTTLEMQRLEEENNRIFIEAYGLQDELTPEVPLHEITLTCNPYYRYDHTKPEAELEALLLADTMKEFLSYAVGCMFGRYSLDKPGLILANQGETIEDYNRQVPERTFPPDEDNVLPILDGDWFIDDITERFRKFLRVTFGEEHYEENLKFIEKAIGKKIRAYFLKDFYNDHVKRYKKRPIYWLFSSPKGSFNALIYMHRYRPDTVSIVLNDYLREFRGKLEARVVNLKQLEVSSDASQSQKTKAIKEITKLTKTIEELNDYERDTLYPLALKQIEIDLDDGVKVNYPKFGAALKKIAGLEAKKK